MSEASLILKKKIRTLSQGPGIYLMRDNTGQIIYVGKALNLNKRVSSYFRSSKNIPVRIQRMVKEICDFETISLKSEEEALILECRYIKEIQPKYNILLKDDKSYPLIRITLQESMPRLLMTRMKKPDGALYLGPYTDAGSLKRTIDIFNRVFKLRTCLYHEPGEGEYKHCLYQMMRWCSAPCVAEISKAQYRESINHVIQILMGHSLDILHSFEKNMNIASKKMQYEKAAQVRDRLQALRSILGSPVRKIRHIIKSTAETSLELMQLKEVLGLDRIPRSIEAYDISNYSGKQAVGSMVRFHDGNPDKRYYRRFKIKNVSGIDDCKMMREVIQRRFCKAKDKDNMLGNLPDLILIDGGKGQLSASFEALKEIGFGDIPILGLAKRLEEIFTVYGQDPICLPHDAQALHVLQRIRDEAHRFAISYHRKLRDLRIRESVLDDVDGIGSAKKRILIRHFGSIHQLKKANVQQIAEMKGINLKLAEKIYRALH